MKSNPALADISYILMKLESEMIPCANATAPALTAPGRREAGPSSGCWCLGRCSARCTRSYPEPSRGCPRQTLLQYQYEVGQAEATLTIIVETELCAGDRHPAIAAQPLAQLRIGEASEHLHVMIGHRVCHLGG